MTRIVGDVTSSVSVELVENWFRERVGYSCPVSIGIFKTECNKLGLNWLGLLAMSIVETGWFTSEIYKQKRNLFGLGAVDSDPMGGAASFVSDELAVRAGAEHLAVYAGAESVRRRLDSEFVLRRTAQIRNWGYVGIVTHYLDLGGKSEDGRIKWASNPGHGMQVENLIYEMSDYCERHAEPESESGSIWNTVISVLKYLHPILAKVNPWLGWIAFGAYTILDYFF